MLNANGAFGMRGSLSSLRCANWSANRPDELRKPVSSCNSVSEMAAQGGIRDKILRVSMPFEKGRNTTRISRSVFPQNRLISGNEMDPWKVILKVRSWASQLGEGRVSSCAEIARREGITRARVSQLWPIRSITREQMDDSLKASRGKDISLRRLIRIARNPDVKRGDPRAENMAGGN